MTSWKENFTAKLEDLKQQNLLRVLEDYSPAKEAALLRQKKRGYHDFCGNDYLGLAQAKAVKKAAILALEKYGFGAGASRYISGNNPLYSLLEAKLARLKKQEEAIVFGSGYLGGIGVIPALVGKNDLIIADKLIHASLLDGAKLSGAKLLRFTHNDLNHCRNLLINQRPKFKNCLIITETVFSMDGDLGEIKGLLTLAKEYNAWLLSDDAHGLGILKNNSDLSSVNGSLYLQMGTLSKAVGGYGGYICGPALIINYLRNYARSAIYSTALPPAVLAGNLKALSIIEKDHKLAKKALENACYFCELLNLPKPDSTIIVVIIGLAAKTLAIAKQLKKQGFMVGAIRPPTVLPNKSRLRLTFSANHHKATIAALAEAIKKLL